VCGLFEKQVLVAGLWKHCYHEWEVQRH